MLPPDNIPVPTRRGIRKLDPTDAKNNFGMFASAEGDHNLEVADYKDIIGNNGESLGLGVRTKVDIKNGEMLPLIVWGTFTTEEKYRQEALAKDEPTDYPRIPGAYALQKPYENVACLMSPLCPARYVNDCRGVLGAVQNIKFVQHPNPRELYYNTMLGMHHFLQAQAIRDIAANDQLFDSYGAAFWEEKAPINFVPVSEAELLDLGHEYIQPEGDEDSDEDKPIQLNPQGRSQLVETPTSLLQSVTSSELMSPVSPLVSIDLTSPMAISQVSTQGEATETPSSSGRGKKRSNPSTTPESESKMGRERKSKKKVDLAHMPQVSSELLDDILTVPKKRNAKKASQSTKRSRQVVSDEEETQTDDVDAAELKRVKEAEEAAAAALSL